MKILLIVEDDLSLNTVLNEKFTREGYIVDTAFDGEEGYRLAIENKPDMILLDVYLPKLGGLEVLKKLRKDEWGKTAKVIILTNYILEWNNQLKELKPLAYLQKSDTTIDDLHLKIKSLL